MRLANEKMLLELIGRIYEASLEPQVWPSVLERLAVEAGNAAASMARVSRGEPAQLGILDDWMRAQEHIDAFEPYASQSRVNGAIAALPSDYDGDQDHDVAVVRALAPHFRRATQVSSRLRQAESEVCALKEALDRISTGVLVLDSHSHVMHVNRAAKRILSHEDTLSIQRDEMTAACTADSQSLRRLLASATRATNEQAIRDGGQIALSRPGHKPLLLTISPIRPTGSDAAEARAAALVFLVDPEDTSELSQETLYKLWKLTRSEARVASLLAAGYSVEEISERLIVQPNTVRAHIKQVFAKTGTNRQAELVALLLRTVDNSSSQLST